MEPSVMLKVNELISQLDPRIRENPRFESELMLALEEAQKLSPSEVRVDLHDNGTILRISSTGVNTHFNERITAENKAVLVVDLRLGDSILTDALVVQYNQGTAFKASSVSGNPAETGVILNSSYQQRIFCPKGIERAYSDYSDNYRFDNRTYTEVASSSQILSNLHQPTMGYRKVPISPTLKGNASSSSAYREDDNLGLLYVGKVEGVTRESPGKVQNTIQAHAGEKIENLHWDNVPYVTILAGGVFEVNKDIQEISGMSFKQIYDKLKDDFALKVELHPESPYYGAIRDTITEQEEAHR